MENGICQRRQPHISTTDHNADLPREESKKNSAVFGGLNELWWCRKQLSLAHPAAVAINHFHAIGTRLCCCTVIKIDGRTLSYSARPDCAATMQKVGGSRDELVFACLYGAIHYLCRRTALPSPRTREESHHLLLNLFFLWKPCRRKTCFVLMLYMSLNVTIRPRFVYCNTIDLIERFKSNKWSQSAFPVNKSIETLKINWIVCGANGTGGRDRRGHWAKKDATRQHRCHHRHQIDINLREKPLTFWVIAPAVKCLPGARHSQEHECLTRLPHSSPQWKPPAAKLNY